MSLTLNGIFNSARDNADNMKQIMKVKRAISKAEDELASLLYELGCEVYDGKINGETREDIVDMLFESIGSVRSSIKSLNAEYNALNGKIMCDGCGKLTSTDFDFCPFCGTKLFETIFDDFDDEDDNLPSLSENYEQE